MPSAACACVNALRALSNWFCCRHTQPRSCQAAAYWGYSCTAFSSSCCASGSLLFSTARCPLSYAFLASLGAFKLVALTVAPCVLSTLSSTMVPTFTVPAPLPTSPTGISTLLERNPAREPRSSQPNAILCALEVFCGSRALSASDAFVPRVLASAVVSGSPSQGEDDVKTTLK